MHKMGLTHVRTVPGCLNTKNFYKLPDSQKKQLRTKNNIDQDKIAFQHHPV